MFSKGFLFLPFVIMSLSLQAQPPGAILVKAGEDFRGVIPRTERYRYPQFQEGVLFYPQSTRSEIMKMNYDLVVGAMQFLDEKGDTLFIAEDSNIFKYIKIQKDLYYHDFLLGYFEMGTREGLVKLLIQNKWKVLRREPVVNNGYSSSASIATTEYSLRRSDINTFVQNENILYTKELYYFLLGKRDKIYKANKAGFVKAFSDHRRQVKQYIGNHDIDFRKEEDIRQALIHFNGLSEK
jgi:hypothetical protein